MVIMNLELENILGFPNFKMNFSYPKKIVSSIIEGEHLAGRPNFRYKKAIVLMGANAAGKTSIGKILMKIFSFINSGNPSFLFEIVSKGNAGSFSIDFINEGFVLHRLVVRIYPNTSEINMRYFYSLILDGDSYEKSVSRFRDCTYFFNPDFTTTTPKEMRDHFGKINFRFAYPEIESSLNVKDIDKCILLKTLKAVLGTLDPTLTNISISSDLQDSFIIRRKNDEIIIQNGKLLNRELLSSGTIEGIDVAFFLASMLSPKEKNIFYYCDEHFSYIQSDIEKRIFGLMIEHLKENEQLIFTTHNTDMLDLNIPKHTFAFLRKKVIEGECEEVSVIYASDILKRNTDSVRHAVENDVFSSLPDDSLLDTLESGGPYEE